MVEAKGKGVLEVRFNGVRGVTVYTTQLCLSPLLICRRIGFEKIITVDLDPLEMQVLNRRMNRLGHVTMLKRRPFRIRFSLKRQTVF